MFLPKYNLKLSKETRHYKIDSPTEVALLLRIFQPSEPHGVWPGNSIIVRSWEICESGQTAYRKCNETEMRGFEDRLGELERVEFMLHPSLGLVAYGPLKVNKGTLIKRGNFRLSPMPEFT